MFVGHYGPALAGKAVSSEIRLWHMFVAVQAVDIAWAGLIMTGIEKARIVPGFMEASDLDLYHMPYTHSLVATGIWMLVALLFYRLVKPSAGWAGAFLIALAVGSHWLTDLFVHTEDLPILFDGPKVGFGLWNSLILSQALEGALLVGGFWLYLRATTAKGFTGKITPWFLLGILATVQVYNHIAPPPPDIQAMAPLALFSYLLLAAIAASNDVTRHWKS